MRIAFLYPTGGESDPRLASFYGNAFLGGLSELGAQLLLIKSDADTPVLATAATATDADPSSAIAQSVRLQNAPTARGYGDDLRALFRTFSPDIVQTFGYASRLSAVWSAVKGGPHPVVHFVTSGGPAVGDRGKLLNASSRVAPPLNSFAGLAARHASRHVSALIGSNRCDVAHHRDSGFFRNAQFSVVAGLPVAPLAEHATGSGRGPTPRFGFFGFDYAPAVVTFLLSAAAATGSHQYTILLQDCYKSIADQWHSINLELTPTHDPDEFLHRVDVVVIPYPDDSFAPVIVRAAAAGKPVIASEGGLAGELLDYGRRGTLFRNGSEADLMGKMLDIMLAWPEGPPLFDSAQEILNDTSPKHCAEIFLAAYTRLAEGPSTAFKRAI
jgi:hypothetical protein